MTADHPTGPERPDNPSSRTHQSNEPVSDAAIVDASLTDPEAFGDLFDRHAATLLRYLTRRVDRRDAEDLLGETFRIAFETRARFDVSRLEGSQPTARPWLYGIAANLVLKHHRSKRRRDHATERLHALPALHVVPDFADHVVGTSVDRALLAKVAELIGLLPDDYREALVLFAWEGLDYGEIAAALAIPIGTVRSRLHRIRVRIRELDDRIGQEPTTDGAATSPVATTASKGSPR